MDDKTPRTYTQEQFNAILRRALDNQQRPGLTRHDELLELGREVGLSADEIERAAREVTLAQGEQNARAAWQSRRKQDFVRAFLVYAVVNLALFLINFLAGGPWWFFWPLLGWGIAVALHAVSVFGPSDAAYERHVEQRKRREEKEQRKREEYAAKHGLREASSKFSKAVRRGVGEVLAQAAENIEAQINARKVRREEPSETSARTGVRVTDEPGARVRADASVEPRAQREDVSNGEVPSFAEHVRGRKAGE